MELLTPRQMSDCEKKSEKYGVSLSALMDNAGFCLAEKIKDIGYSQFRRRVLFLCGNGNNGGDGFVAAKILSQSGFEVSVMLLCGNPKTDLAKSAFGEMPKEIEICENADIESFDIICDCVFGTGFRGNLPTEISEIFERVNSSDCIKTACDLPSGVNALTGEADSSTIRCDETVTFHRAKLGMLLSPAREYCGKISVCDISIPKEACTDKPIKLCDKDFIKSVLPKRPPNGHKGTFGKLVCICGSRQYPGAAAMSTLAALRSGCGIVNLASTSSVVDTLSKSIFEATYTALDDKDGQISADADIENTLKSADCVLFGCGLGNTENTLSLLKNVLSIANCPIVIDADGINCLSGNIDILKDTNVPVILTPHPAELARLCGLDKAPADRLSAALELAEKYGVTVMAKSAQTLIVSRDGVTLCDKGNTALSKGGSGDMLAGITASLIAQGIKPEFGCAAASYILGSAAEYLASNRSERGIIARDIIDALPFVFFNLEG